MGLFDGILDTVSDVFGSVKDFVSPAVDFLTGDQFGKVLKGGADFLNSNAFQTGVSAYAADRAYDAEREKNAAQERMWQQGMEFSGEQARIAREFNVYSSDVAYDRSSTQAQIQRDWAEQMAGTQWQRAVGDLTKAGLNPMLAYSKGPNAVPSGAAAGVSPAAASPAPSAGAAPQLGNPAAVGWSTAVQVGRTMAELDQMKANTERIRAEARKVAAETAYVVGPQTTLAGAQARTATAQEANISQDTALKVEQMVKVMAEVDAIAERNHLTRAEVEKVKADTLNAALTGAHIKAETRNTIANAQLNELAIPHMKNMSAAESTWFKQNVSPFLPDFLRGSSIFRQFGR